MAWGKIGRVGDGSDVLAMAYFSGNLYAGSCFGTDARLYRHEGGSVWTDVSGVIGSVGSSVLCLREFNSKLYIAIGYDNDSHIYSYDGASIADCGSPDAGDCPYCLGIHGGALYAGGYYGGAWLYAGGTSWTAIGPTGLGTCLAVCSHGGDLFITGEIADTGIGNVRHWNGGTSWSKAGHLGSSSTWVYGMLSFSGSMYAGTDSSSIFKYAGWPGTTWSEYVLGYNVFALLEYNGHIAAGTGNIGTVGLYNGDAGWEDLGRLGLSNYVDALATDGTNLYGGTTGGSVYQYPYTPPPDGNFTKINEPGGGLKPANSKFGRLTALSTDGTRLAATTDGPSCGRVFLYEKQGDTFEPDGFIDYPDAVTWTDPFDGETGKDRLQDDAGVGTIVESDGSLTISTPASAAPWTTCPIAWRYESDANATVLETEILSMTADPDFHAGIVVYDTGQWEIGSRDTSGYLAEVFYEDEFKIRLQRLMHWEAMGQLGASTGGIYTLCMFEGSLYAGGTDQKVYRHDGATTWTVVSDVLGNSGDRIWSLAVHDSKLFASPGPTSGAASRSVYRYDGTPTWTNVGTPSGSDYTRVLCSHGGSLYAAISAGGVLVWDGTTTWTTCGNPSVTGLTLCSHGGSLYAGGVGTVSRDVAVWAGGTTWNTAGALGTSAPYTVPALTSYSGQLYAACNSGGNCYRWEGGTTWTNLGGGYSSNMTGVAMLSSGMYFSASTGMGVCWLSDSVYAHTRIAEAYGSGWTYYAVYSLLSDGTYLYAGFSNGYVGKFHQNGYLSTLGDPVALNVSPPFSIKLKCWFDSLSNLDRDSCFDVYLLVDGMWQLLIQQSVTSGGLYEWYVLTRQGLYARNSGSNPAGSISFGSMTSSVGSHWRYNPSVTDGVSIEGDTLAVLQDCNVGLTVSERTEITSASTAGFGQSVTTIPLFPYDSAKTLTYLVVGDTGWNSGQGRVHVLRLEEGVWEPFQILTADDGASGDAFGWAVCFGYVLDSSDGGTTLLISAKNATVSGQAGAGAVYSFWFPRATKVFAQHQKIVSNSPAGSGAFGFCLYHNGTTTLSVGEPYGNSNKGCVQLFTKATSGKPGTWASSYIRTASDGDSGDEYGYSVYNSMIGAPGKNSNKGKVYIPTGLVTTLEATDGVAGDRFGEAVLYYSNSDWIAIGAPGRNSTTGSIYTFATVYYHATEILAPSYLEVGDRFGCSFVRPCQEIRFFAGADRGGSTEGFLIHFANATISHNVDSSTSKYRGWGDVGVINGGAIGSVSMHRLYVGDPTADSGAGAVHEFYTPYTDSMLSYGDRELFIYDRTAPGAWELNQRIVNPEAGNGTGFGETVALSHDAETVVVADGEEWGSICGPQCVYTRSGGTFGSIPSQVIDTGHGDASLIWAGADHCIVRMTESEDIKVYKRTAGILSLIQTISDYESDYLYASPDGEWLFLACDPSSNYNYTFYAYRIQEDGTYLFDSALPEVPYYPSTIYPGPSLGMDSGGDSVRAAHTSEYNLVRVYMHGSWSMVEEATVPEVTYGPSFVGPDYCVLSYPWETVDDVIKAGFILYAAGVSYLIITLPPATELGQRVAVRFDMVSNYPGVRVLPTGADLVESETSNLLLLNGEALTYMVTEIGKWKKIMRHKP